jgi:hypothetical protein
MNIFGFEIKKLDVDNEKGKTFVPLTKEDGAIEIDILENSYGYSGSQQYSLDLDSIPTDEVELIYTYRNMALNHDIDMTIQEIVNEAIIIEDSNASVDIILENVDLSDQIKDKIKDEFVNVLKLLNFKNDGYGLFRKWYIDGKLVFHKVIDEKSQHKGIIKLVPIDPLNIKKVRETKKEYGSVDYDIYHLEDVNEYFIYSRKPFEADNLKYDKSYAVRIPKDIITYVTSGLMGADGKLVLSQLYKAIKTFNNLKMMEDSLVIYRVARAPERRVFYVDVGSLPSGKADQYLKSVMDKFKTKVTYDIAKGNVTNRKNFQSMLEDYWLPRREGCLKLDTKIKLLDNRDLTLSEIIDEYQDGKELWTYSVSDDGEIKPGLISWAGITRKNADIIRIHLDNGEYVDATLDHKFILRTGQKIEAEDLKVGDSLMPIYTDRKKLSKTKYSGEYNRVFDNKTSKYIFTHRMVSNYINGTQKKSEVIHHIDFDRYNNNPNNLQIMDKKEHFALHSKCGTNSWKNGNYEEHCKNLSISGKNFFNSDRGKLRKEEIREFNKTSKEVNDGLILGRKKSKEQRKSDKVTLSKEEYMLKWFPHSSSNISTWNEKQKKLYKSYGMTFDDICEIIDNNFHRKITTKEILDLLNIKFDNNVKLNHILKHLKDFGYNSMNEYLSDMYSLDYKWYGQNSKYRNYNHKITKIEYIGEPFDVGTLTIDEDEIHHNHHNFALTSGVFVMNSRGTEISTLPGGENLSELADVEYFKQKLYDSLNVPLSRFQQDGSAMFTLGRTSEITREEVRFNKFIKRLRSKFSRLFDDILKTQLILKKVISAEEWETIEQDINYSYMEDNYFTELKQLEVLQERVQTAESLFQAEFVGKYYSNETIRKDILKQSESEIEMQDEQIRNEKSNEIYYPKDDNDY